MTGWVREVEIQNEETARQDALQGLADAGQAFLTAWDKSHQLEKTDVAVRLMRAALAKAKPFLPKSESLPT